MVHTAPKRELSERDKQRAAQKDLFPIQGIDYIELYVGNALQAAHYYRLVWGYDIIGYRGPRPGSATACPMCWSRAGCAWSSPRALSSQGDDRRSTSHRHGDGVKDIALRVPDVDQAYHVALSRGRARACCEPQSWRTTTARSSARPSPPMATRSTAWSTRDYRGAFMPGFQPRGRSRAKGVGIRVVDHVVGNVELGQHGRVGQASTRTCMGFEQLVHFNDEQITTEYSALMSKVVQDGTGKIKFPINEPAQGKKKSQIDEYLDYYRGPGAQHVAVATGDILATVRDAARPTASSSCARPHTYYAGSARRASARSRKTWRSWRTLGILADRDDDGYLLQIFSKPVQDRPTLFYELIERHGARGFGEGNFKALFEAIEREQALRGNL